MRIIGVPVPVTCVPKEYDRVGEGTTEATGCEQAADNIAAIRAANCADRGAGATQPANGNDFDMRLS